MQNSTLGVIAEKVEVRTAPSDDLNAEQLADYVHRATESLREYKTAGPALIQRRLGLGYTRAAQILTELERMGIVGPIQDNGQREVLKHEFLGTTRPRYDWAKDAPGPRF